MSIVMHVAPVWGVFLCKRAESLLMLRANFESMKSIILPMT
jgi:hypothetical protein